MSSPGNPTDVVEAGGMQPRPDDERFLALWTPVQPAVAAFVSTMLRNHDAVDEAVQRTAIAAWRKLSTYDPERSFISWVLGIARYEALECRRTAARSCLVRNPELLEQLAEVHAEQAEAIDHRVDALRRCLDHVQGRAKELVNLCYVESLAPAEIAKRVGLAAGAVRVALHRVRQDLQDCVERRTAAEERQ